MYFFLFFCYTISSVGIGMNIDLIKKIKAEKANKQVRKFIADCKKESVVKKIDINKYLKYGDLNEFIKIFNNTFEETIGNDRKKTFNKNIKKLKIYQVPGKFELNKKDTGGTYEPLKNRITIYGNDNDYFEMSEKLMHELLHLASNKANGLIDGLTISTAYEKGGYFVTGNGLNEGYTELLNSRYFARQNNSTGYNQEMVIAAGIEKIVGKDKMLDAYFKYSLIDVLNELEEYYGDHEYYLNLIKQIDLFNRLNDSCKRKELYKKIKSNIIDIYRCKLVKELKYKKIDFNEFCKNKFFGIDLYDKYDFIYDKHANIVESVDKYMVVGDSSFYYLNKDDEHAKFYMKNR